MTRSIQSISEIRRHAQQCAAEGASIDIADDLDQDVREFWLEAFKQYIAQQSTEQQS
jgi:hypothetical protein